MYDYIFNRLSRLVFLYTFFAISISFAGLLYFDGLSRNLGFDNSLFDLDFVAFFERVLISDQHNIMANITIFLLFFISFVVLYPKSLIFIFDISRLGFLSIGGFLGGANTILIFFLIYISPFLIPLVLVILILQSFGMKLVEMDRFRFHIESVKQKLAANAQYNESKSRVGEGSEDFLRSNVVFFTFSLLLIFWLAWAIYIGNQGKKHADIYLTSKEYKTVYLTNNTEIKAVFVSKVKNGYLFVLNDGDQNKDKASFIPDGAILRID